MACVTLKRPLEWTDPSMSPESGSSSPTNMIISNSPPHHGLRSPKRLCLQSGVGGGNGGVGGHQSSPSSCNFSSFINPSLFSTNNSSNNSNNNNNHSVLFHKTISSSEIANQIRDEIARLRLIRRSLFNNKNKTATLPNDGLSRSKSPSPSESSMGSPSSSPRPSQDVNVDNSSQTDPVVTSTSSTSPSSSSSEISLATNAYNLYTNLINQHRRKDDDNPESFLKNSLSSTANKKQAQTISNNTLPKSGTNNRTTFSVNDQQPLFTFNQVVMIVERILRENESSIRREFEQVLANRLAEQYDQFVNFSFDQIQRRFDSQALPSYLS